MPEPYLSRQLLRQYGYMVEAFFLMVFLCLCYAPLGPGPTGMIWTVEKGSAFRQYDKEHFYPVPLSATWWRILGLGGMRWCRTGVV